MLQLLCPCVILHIYKCIRKILPEVELLDQKIDAFVILIVIANLPSVEIIPIDIRTSNFENACSPHSGQLSRLFIHPTNNFSASTL